MSDIFEYRLQELGTCVKELTNRAQYLHILFEICLQDYKNNIHKKFKSNSHKNNSSNNISENISQKPLKKEEKSKIKKELPMGHEYTGIKRKSPELGEQSLENKEVFKRQESSESSSESPSPLNTSEEYKLLENIPQKPLKTQKKRNKGPRALKTAHKTGPYVFSKLTKEEKELILGDKISLGTYQCERKWGIDHSVLLAYHNKSSHLFENKEDRELWVNKVRKYLDIKHIKENIELAITENCPNNSSPIDLHELCSMCLDRGLGEIATKYNINLFELEFLLQVLYPREWAEMENNKWFSIRRDSHNNPIKMSKLEIAILSNAHGVRYASKRSGVFYKIIAQYRKKLLNGVLRDEENDLAQLHKIIQEIRDLNIYIYSIYIYIYTIYIVYIYIYIIYIYIYINRMLKEGEVIVESWTVLETCEWLNSVGLGRHTEAFMVNDINGITLLCLDEQALVEELNISSRLHRITLLKELGKLKTLQITHTKGNENYSHPHKHANEHIILANPLNLDHNSQFNSYISEFDAHTEEFEKFRVEFDQESAEFEKLTEELDILTKEYQAKKEEYKNGKKDITPYREIYKHHRKRYKEQTAIYEAQKGKYKDRVDNYHSQVTKYKEQIPKLTAKENQAIQLKMIYSLNIIFILFLYIL